jgi:hypothetical protein
VTPNKPDLLSLIIPKTESGYVSGILLAQQHPHDKRAESSDHTVA